MDISVTSNLFPMQGCTPYNSEFLDAYGTLSEANIYFDNRLRSVAWKLAKKEDKKSAMKEATEMIDCLDFIGSKTDSAQIHQFPRQTNIDVPTDIKYACFEIAIKLIQGYDPDREADILAVQGQSYSGVKTSYNRTFVPDYMRAGIPSFSAWTYLKPYLRNPEEIDLNRL